MKKTLQVLLVALLFALMITTVVSAKTFEVDSKVESSINSDIGNWLTGKETDTYEFVADETQYYKFSLKNHSVTLEIISEMLLLIFLQE